MKRAVAVGLMLAALSACTSAKIDLADIKPVSPPPVRVASAPAPAHAEPALALAPVGAIPAAEAVDANLVTASLPFADSDPHPFKGVVPASYPVHGIDISKYQGDIDWGALKSNGVSFVFMKATEGGDYVDPRFAGYWKAAARMGIPHGAYHFYYFCRPAIQQARWFIRNVPRDRGALPPVLDIEWNHASRTCKRRPSPAQVRRDMKIFMRVVERHFGKRPIIYTTPDFFHDNLVGAFTDHEFWLRSVAGHPSDIYPNGRHWRFWQYTGTGIVPGISGNADINAFGGNTADWQAWLKANRVAMN